jgi:hypothetical protein
MTASPARRAATPFPLIRLIGGAQAEGALGLAADQPAVTRVRNGPVGGRHAAQIRAQAAQCIGTGPGGGLDALGARTAGPPARTRLAPGERPGEQQDQGAGAFLDRSAAGAGQPELQRIFPTTGVLSGVLTAIGQDLARGNALGEVRPMDRGRVVHGGRGMR